MANCIVCHRKGVVNVADVSTSAEDPGKVERFLLEKIFDAGESVARAVRKANVDPQLLYQMCSQCSSTVNCAVSLMEQNAGAAGALVAHLKKTKETAIFGREGSPPVPSSSSSIPFVENAIWMEAFSPVEVDLLRRVEHLKMQKMMEEHEGPKLVEEQAKAETSGAIALSMPEPDYVEFPKPGFVLETAVRSPPLQLADQALMPPPPPLAPTMVLSGDRTMRKTKKKKGRRYEDDALYRYVGPEVYGDLRKSLRKRNLGENRDADQGGVMPTPPAKKPKPSQIRRKRLRKGAVESSLPKAATDIPPKPDAKKRGPKGNDRSFYAELEVYGPLVLNMTKLTEVETASDELKKLLEAAPGKYHLINNKETGERVSSGFDQCSLCKKHFANKYYLVYHIERVHFGTLSPCKCAVCERPYTSLQRAVEHVKACFQKQIQVAEKIEEPVTDVEKPPLADLKKKKFPALKEARLVLQNLGVPTCWICGEKFSTFPPFIEHVRRHSLEWKDEETLKSIILYSEKVKDSRSETSDQSLEEDSTENVEESCNIPVAEPEQPVEQNDHLGYPPGEKVVRFSPFQGIITESGEMQMIPVKWSVEQDKIAVHMDLHEPRGRPEMDGQISVQMGHTEPEWQANRGDQFVDLMEQTPEAHPEMDGKPAVQIEKTGPVGQTEMFPVQMEKNDPEGQLEVDDKLSVQKDTSEPEEQPEMGHKLAVMIDVLKVQNDPERQHETDDLPRKILLEQAEMDHKLAVQMEQKDPDVQQEKVDKQDQKLEPILEDEGPMTRCQLMKIRHTCIICDAEFKDDILTLFHLVTIHGAEDVDGRFPVCTQCGQFCLNEFSLGIHVDNFHP